MSLYFYMKRGERVRKSNERIYATGDAIPANGWRHSNHKCNVVYVVYVVWLFVLSAAEGRTVWLFVLSRRKDGLVMVQALGDRLIEPHDTLLEWFQPHGVQ